MLDFDKEKFINHCCPHCDRFRKTMLEKIEQYRDSEPEMVKALIYYRDELWDAQVKNEERRARFNVVGEEQLCKDAVIALRAMADQIEKGSFALLLHAELPQVPIFSKEDSSISNIEITLAKHFMGG